MRKDQRPSSDCVAQLWQAASSLNSTPNYANMAAASLLTLPVEIRLAIWKYVVPRTVEAIVPGNYEAGEHTRWDYIQLPQNARLPLLLTNKQAKDEVEKLSPTTLVLRCRDTQHLDEWLERSTLHDKKIVGRIRIDDQVIRDLELEEPPERRARSHEWWLNRFGDDLVCYYHHVKSLGSELTYRYHRGFLDVTFEVGDCHDLQRKWEFGRYESGLPSDTLSPSVTKPLAQTVRTSLCKAGETMWNQRTIQVLVCEAQEYWCVPDYDK